MSETVNVGVSGDVIDDLEERLNGAIASGQYDDRPDGTMAAWFDGARHVLETLGFSVIVGDGVSIVPPGADPDAMSTSEAAELLGLSEQRVRQLLSEEPPKLLGRKAGRSWVVSRRSAEEFRDGHPRRWSRGRRP